MTKFKILMMVGALAILPFSAMAEEATTVTVEGSGGSTTVVTTPQADAGTTVVVDPDKDKGPRDAISGELVKPVEEKPEEMSLRDKVRSEMKEDPADKRKEMEDEKK